MTRKDDEKVLLSAVQLHTWTLFHATTLRIFLAGILGQTQSSDVNFYRNLDNVHNNKKNNNPLVARRILLLATSSFGIFSDLQQGKAPAVT